MFGYAFTGSQATTRSDVGIRAWGVGRYMETQGHGLSVVGWNTVAVHRKVQRGSSVG